MARARTPFGLALREEFDDKLVLTEGWCDELELCVDLPAIELEVAFVS